MKKILAVLIALVMVFVLVACSGNKTDTTDTNKDTKVTEDKPLGRDDDIDFQSIMSGKGSTNVVYGDLDAVRKAEIIAEGARNGLDVSFGNDGSMTIKDEEGNEYKQNSDGTWLIKTDSGSYQSGGNWPDNEFTKLVPKPGFTLAAAATTEDEFTVTFQGVTVDQVKAYVEQVKAKGFTADADIQDQVVSGITLYSYEASNSNGYTVLVFFTMGTSGLTITKN